MPKGESESLGWPRDHVIRGDDHETYKIIAGNIPFNASPLPHLPNILQEMCFTLVKLTSVVRCTKSDLEKMLQLDYSKNICQVTYRTLR